MPEYLQSVKKMRLLSQMQKVYRKSFIYPGVYKSRNLGAVVVSHDMDLLKRFCDSIIDFLKINNQAGTG